MRLGVRGVGHEVVLEGDVEGRVVVGPPFGDLEVGVVGDLEEGESRREVDVEVEAVGALTVFGLDLRGSHREPRSGPWRKAPRSIGRCLVEFPKIGRRRSPTGPSKSLSP